MGGIARLRSPTCVGVVLACICALLGVASAALAGPSSALQTVRYHGVSVRVPRSWRVFNLARDRQECVRFNRHALYLGTPGSEERCPAHVVGRTEAILISPAHAGRSAPSATAGGLALGGDATSFSLRSSGVDVTATWSRSPQVISRALGRRSLPAPARASEGGAPSLPANSSERAARSHIRATVYRGLGFDTCLVPSTHVMSAWSSSPYRAVGAYLGGINEGCAQPNLNKAWVDLETAAGWHLIPIWVGLQAHFNGCGCRGMNRGTSLAHTEGERAASSAVTQAQLVGIGPGNPIYYDMEGYPIGHGNAHAVEAYVSGWTSRLHAEHYLSGVYSSADSGIHNLVMKYGTGFPEPNDIWIADWNGRKTVLDPYVPRADWAPHRRLHQFFGGKNRRYGGVTLNVDGDFLNGATAGTGAARRR